MHSRSNATSVVVRKYWTMLLVFVVAMVAGGHRAHSALLDGLLEGVEEHLAEGVAKKGEELTVGNFYAPERPDSHGPMGTIGEHTHNAGEFMFTYRYSRMFMDGNRDGTDDLSDGDVLQDFPITPRKMTTEMHMFMGMYGFNDTVTLMAMFPWIEKSMDHVTRNGTKFETNSSGIGDIKLISLWRLWAVEAPSIGSHRFHLNAGVSLPSGDIKAHDDTPAGSDQRLPYPMQLGSGTVDLLPGLTYMGSTSNVSWGLQGLGTIRLGENDESYRKGHNYEITGFGAYRWTDWLSTSARLQWQQWFNYVGRDRNLNPAVIPTADPKRRAGRRLNALGGFNILLPEWDGLENRINFEAGAPLYQHLDGPQLELDYVLYAGWQFIK